MNGILEYYNLQKITPVEIESKQIIFYWKKKQNKMK